MISDTAIPRQLSGNPLLVARLAWVTIVVPALVFGIWGLAIGVQRPELNLQPTLQDVVSSFGLSGGQGVLLFRALPALTTVLIAATMLALRSDDGVVLLGSAGLVTGAVSISDALKVLLASEPSMHIPVRMMWSVGLFTFVLTICVFPDGRFVPRWTGILAFFALAYAVAPHVPEFYMRFPEVLRTSPPWRSALVHLGITGVLGATFLAQYQRYRRFATPLQRRQTRWVIGCFALGLALIGQAIVIEVSFGRVGVWSGISLVAAFIPSLGAQIALAASIVRHRLLDIDLIVNRTVVYTILTGLLAAGYATTVFVLGIVLRPLTGGSGIAVAVSTLLVAAAFGPLRRHIQTTVDHRFNRARYDAARIIERFTARLRDEIDIDALGAELTDVVNRTMQPERVNLWMRS